MKKAPAIVFDKVDTEKPYQGADYKAFNIKRACKSSQGTREDSESRNRKVALSERKVSFIDLLETNSNSQYSDN